MQPHKSSRELSVLSKKLCADSAEEAVSIMIHLPLVPIVKAQLEAYEKAGEELAQLKKLLKLKGLRGLFGSNFRRDSLCFTSCNQCFFPIAVHAPA